MNMLACPAGHLTPRGSAAQPIPTADPPGAGVDLGIAPWLAFLAACGLVIVAIADNQAAIRGFHPNALFWMGTLVILVPHAVRLSMPIGRFEVLALLVSLTVVLYFVKLLLSPAQFAFHDEFLHWRTTDDIIQTGRLFAENPLLPTSARYPALESATAALAEMAGISIFQAGVVVIGIARVAFMLALFLTLEIGTGSRRLAAIGAVVYTANPNFLMFSAAYKYETIALTFAALCLYLAVEWTRALYRPRGLFVGAALAAALTATSHHVTAIVLTALLVGWCVTAAVLHRSGRALHHPAPWSLALVSFAATFGWILVAAPVAIAYLAPVIGGAVGQGLALLAKLLGAPNVTPGVRDLFGGSQPGGAPLWERLTTIAAVAITFAMSVGGAWLLVRRHTRDPLIVSMLIAIPAYPATLFLRLTPRGWETANRSSEFLFAALAVPIAAAFLALVFAGARLWWRSMLVGGVIGIMFAGGVVAGLGIADRLPGPYLCCQAPRALNEESLSLAFWMRRSLPGHSRVGADPLNHLLIGSYGRQTAQTTLSGGIDPNWVIFGESFDANVRSLLTGGAVRYIVIDDRVSSDPAGFDEYVGDWTISHALSKFDDARLDRLYDSGHIHLVDVARLWLTE